MLSVMSDATFAEAKVALLVQNPSNLDSDEDNIHQFLVSNSIAYDILDASMIKNNAINLSSYDVLYMRTGTEPVSFNDVDVITKLMTRINNGGRLIFEYYGVYLGQYLGVGTVNISGWFPVVYDESYFVEAVTSGSFFDNITDWSPPNLPDRNNQMIVRLNQPNTYYSCPVFHFSSGSQMFQYWTLLTTYGWGGCQITNSDYCNANTGLCTCERSIYLSDNSGTFSNQSNGVEYIRLGNGSIYRLGLNIGQAAPAGNITFGPVATQMRLNLMTGVGGCSSNATTLSGKVLDAMTGAALQGIPVWIDSTSTTNTDSGGNYSFSGLTPGAHTVTVNVFGYAYYAQYLCDSSFDIRLAKSSTVYGSQTSSGYSQDPVNTATGNYIYNKKDLQMPGKGINFVFERNYNSQDPSDGPLGYGWTHTYNARLFMGGDSSITIRWGDGKTETWTPDGLGGYTPQYGVFDALIDNGDGTYTVKKKNQARYNFNTSGYLSGITDRNSNTIALTYTGGNLSQITDTAGRNIGLAYDGSNRIAAITDPLGMTIAFTYDASGNLTSATDRNGNVTAYTYDADHQMLTVVDPRGNTVVSNTYDAEKRVVTSQRDAKMGQTTYTYDEINKKTTITDQLGYQTIHYHDELLRLVQETDSLGNSAYYTYDTAGNRTEVKDKKGNITAYTYDTAGNVLTKTDALNNVTTITYDSNNNPLTRTDALTNTATFQYDASGNLIKNTDPLGNFAATTYNTSGQILTFTDARGNSTTNTYDAEGNLIEVQSALGNKTIYTYDGLGRKLTAKDALNRTATYTYDNNDNLLTVTDPLGNDTTYTYDGNNNKLTATDPMGNTTSYAYDVKDLLTTVTDSLGNTTTYTYDALDRKTSIKDKRGNTTSYSYDAVGNLLSVSDPLGNITTYTYDANGNKLTETNPLSQTVTYTYDALNRVVSVKDPLNNTSTNTYDALGRIIATTNAKGQTTSFEYDAMGRLKKVIDSNGGVVTYTYDANGNRLTMTEPNGNTTSYTYDVLNRLTMKIEPLGGTYQYDYDAVGNRVSLTDAKGDVIAYQYDSNNRLALVTYPDSSTVAFTYNANGNRTQMVDSLGTSTYSYDALNRMTSYTDPFGKTVGYAYDANNNRTSITYPDGKTVTYAYDALNRLIVVTDWLSGVTAYTYDAAGKVTAIANPNNTAANYTYDSAGRLTGLVNTKSDSTVISNYNYTLDAIGNHTSVTQNEPLAPVIASKNINYSYDTENRLTNAGSTANTFDANGNMTARGSDAFTYDYNDRLIQSSIGGVVAQYNYDGVGNRLVKTDSGATTRYVLDVTGSLSNVLAETDESGVITAYYVYGLGLVSKIVPDGTANYYHYDSRGSAVALTDAGQNITDKYAYSSFGAVANSEGATSNPFRYVGRYGIMDEGNGLEYIRARYYAPELGRFITKDPLTGKDGDSQSLNRYVYALNNPVRLVDVSGFSALEGQVSNKHEWSSDEAHERYLRSIQNWRMLSQQAEIAAQYNADLTQVYYDMVKNIDDFASFVTSTACDAGIAPACGLGAFDKVVDVAPIVYEMLNSKLDTKEATREIFSNVLDLIGDALKDQTSNIIAKGIINGFIWTAEKITDKAIDAFY